MTPTTTASAPRCKMRWKLISPVGRSDASPWKNLRKDHPPWRHPHGKGPNHDPPDSMAGGSAYNSHIVPICGVAAHLCTRVRLIRARPGSPKGRMAVEAPNPCPPRPLPGAKLSWGVWIPCPSLLQPQAPRPPVAEGFALQTAGGGAGGECENTRAGSWRRGLRSARAVLLASVEKGVLDATEVTNRPVADYPCGYHMPSNIVV